MNIEEAISLISFEAKSSRGIVVATRLYEFPSSIRVQVLIEALEVFFKHHKKSENLDRDIAHSLFKISFHTQANIEAAHSSKEEIDQMFSEEIIVVFLLVESIFENKWLLG